MSTTSSPALTGAQIRQQFIDFFVKEHEHTFVRSSPVAPLDDPTLLFTNAGMNQFKPIFLGQADPSTDMGKLRRAANSQKCIRAGGKHNDLDDVGKDTYHHTFFEMLGNWSFGDYFKAEAIEWAWRLLTEVWGLDPERLYATYFEGASEQGLDPDREAYELWQRHLPAARVLPGDMKDNFWEMGDTGPCGPCSELHYDGRPDAERAETPGYNLVNRDHPDVIEVWNLVFIQFNRSESGLASLPAKHVDTGMGLERITRILQGKHSNYDTDLFMPIFGAIKQICGARAYGGSLTDPVDIAYRVIADHVRTLTFAIADGAEPSNEGRGYVLRRILRRAVRHGRQTLGVQGSFLCEIAPTVIETMAEAFPELRDRTKEVIDVIRDEEEAFGRTLDRGIALFDEAAGHATKNNNEVSGADAFKLHDTYGFPVDLTQVMAEERGMTVDVAGFEREMEAARERARTGGAHADEAHPASTLPTEAVAQLRHMNIKETDDASKFELKPISATIRAIWNGTDFDEDLDASTKRPTDRFGIVLDKTCFYAEMGGQVGDTGALLPRSGGEFDVESTKTFGGFVLHFGQMRKGVLRVGDGVKAKVDQDRRAKVMSNHTATHLLNFGLREVVDEKSDQKGSLVAEARLRFDYSSHGALSPEDADRIEQLVRKQIDLDLHVSAEPAPLAEGKAINGLRAVFGETYPDPVRIVSIGAPVSALVAAPDSEEWRSLSIEFCGGTHVASTKEIGGFAIIEESPVAKGVRRVVAITGEDAISAIELGKVIQERVARDAKLEGEALEKEVGEIAHLIDDVVIPYPARRNIVSALDQLRSRLKESRKAAAKAERGASVDEARAIAESASGDAIVAQIEAACGDRDALLAAMDTIRSKRESAAVMLMSVDDEAGKVVIVANVPKDLVGAGLKAGDWVREAAGACGGKGGGRPDSAQGGGTQPENIPAALDAARAFSSRFTS